MNIHWQPVSRLNRVMLAGNIRKLLGDPGSLTNHLKRYCPAGPDIVIKKQSWQRPLPNEIRCLRLSGGTRTFIREIFLTCDGRPWVYGRSILPADTVSGSERRLLNWGRKSLGDYLFTSRKSYRGRIEVARIPTHSRLFKLTGCSEAGLKALWGRRSIFYIKGKPLLVIEVLLPDGYSCLG